MLFGGRILLDRKDGGIHLAAQIGKVTGDNGEAQMCVRLESTLAGTGEKLEADRIVERMRKLVCRRNKVCVVGTRNQKKFSGRRTKGVLACCTRVFFDRDMKIAAAEAERRNTSTPWMGCITNPRPRLGIHIERAFIHCQVWIRTVHLDCGREYFVMQCQHRLDE